jgi:hypothetical protein
VVGHCYLHESGGKNFTSAATYIRTSEAGSFAQGYSGEGSEQALEPNEDVQISEDTAEGLAETHEANYASTDDGSWGGENSNGTLALNGFGNQGVWLQGASGPACSFAGFLVVE